jgi:hypothetical protein
MFEAMQLSLMLLSQRLVQPVGLPGLLLDLRLAIARQVPERPRGVLERV